MGLKPRGGSSPLQRTSSREVRLRCAEPRRLRAMSDDGQRPPPRRTHDSCWKRIDRTMRQIRSLSRSEAFGPNHTNTCHVEPLTFMACTSGAGGGAPWTRRKPARSSGNALSAPSSVAGPPEEPDEAERSCVGREPLEVELLGRSQLRGARDYDSARPQHPFRVANGLRRHRGRIRDGPRIARLAVLGHLRVLSARN